jgi:hypothetical protein
MSNGTTTITIADSTEQDAEYQVTPAPPTEEEDFPPGPPDWTPIQAETSQQRTVTLPVRVTFRVDGQQPSGVITPGKTTATLVEVGSAFRVNVS